MWISRLLLLVRYSLQYRFKLLQRIALPSSKKKNVVFLIGFPRSGTTLLHTLLHSHPHLFSFGEKLQDEFNQQQDFKMIQSILKESARFNSVLTHYLFKVFYEFTSHKEAKLFLDRLEKEYTVYYLHLSRKDFLKVYTSLSIARQTGKWASRYHQNPNDPKIEIKAEQLLEAYEKYQTQKQITQSLLANRTSMEISYEQLTNHPKNTLKEIQAFLRLPHKKLYTILVKQSKQKLSDKIINYHSLMDELEGTSLKAE